MKVVIAGGTGFLGSPLARHMRGEARGSRAHTIADVRRSHDPGTGSPATVSAGLPMARPVHGLHASRLNAIVNLSGDALDRGRWTPAQTRLRDGRILATRSPARDPQPATAGRARERSGVDYYASSGARPPNRPHPDRFPRAL
jgi:NAD dependent epimerase/dehydratase family enzyme